MGATKNKPQTASTIEVGDVVKFDHLGWRKVLEADTDYGRNGGWVYLTIEGHSEENYRKQKCSIRYDIELPRRRN